MGGDGQTVLNLAGTGTKKFSARLFLGLNLYFGGTGTTIFLVGCFAMGGDGQTVLNLAGTGITKILAGLFLGVNSYFGGTVTAILLVGIFHDEW